MPVALVGRTDDASFTSGTFLGWGNGNGNSVGYPVNSAGTVTHFRTRVQNFGPNTTVLAGIYRQTGGTGSFALVASVEIPASSGAEPQTVALASPLTATMGDVYNVAFFGDVTSTSGSEYYSIRLDPTISGGGAGAVSGSYPTLPNPLSPPFPEIEGQLFWQLRGTELGAADLTVTETLVSKGSANVPISNRSLNVAVLDPSDYSVIAAPVAQTSAAGVIIRSGLTGVAADDEVLLAVEDPAEEDPLARNRVYRVAVFDANAE
jgi:hypothetical protein